MPNRKTASRKSTRNALKNAAYESRVISWLMQDGWQVFTPMLENRHKTDILISDGPSYYRIEVKTVQATGEDHKLENRWTDSNVDIVVAFARNSSWGYVMPAFKVNSRRLNYEGHVRFKQNKNDFLKAFHALEV